MKFLPKADNNADPEEDDADHIAVTDAEEDNAN
jgi:hypothetical protein